MSRFGPAANAASALAALRTGSLPDASSGIGREQLSQKYSIKKSAAAASSIITPGKLVFFQDNADDQVTNIVRPGQLSQGKGVFVARALAIDIDIDQETVADSLFSKHATAAVAIGAAECLRRLIKRGAITLYKGQRSVLSAFGCQNFPAGGGVFSQVAVATAVGATELSVQAFNVNNGTPDADNMRWFPSPILFAANDNATLTIDYGATTFPLLTTDKVRWTVSLWGSEMSDAAD
jgi:hypothetical protein